MSLDYSVAIPASGTKEVVKSLNENAPQANWFYFTSCTKIEQNLTLLTLCSVTFSKFSFQFKEERNLLKIYAKLYKENMHSILAISTETDAINMDHSKRTISFE